MNELPIFYATTIHLQHIVTALNCLVPFGVKDEVLVTIDNNGLSFIRENNHVIRIKLVLSADLFQTFHYRPEEEGSSTKVSLRLDHILHSLNATNERNDLIECTLTYDGHGCPFVMIFEDEMLTENVEYATYVLKDIDDAGLILDRPQLNLECIIKGDVLYNALHDLKEIGCKDCFLYANTDAVTKRPILSLISRSQQGLSKIIFPNERSILEKCHIYADDAMTRVYNQPLISMFDYSTLDKIRLSCKVASKIMIRRDVHGLVTFNMLDESTEILTTNDKTSPNSNTARSNSNLRCPGIIIEASVLEKASPELSEVREIESLMMEYVNNGDPRYNEPDPSPINGKKADNTEEYEAVEEDVPLFF